MQISDTITKINFKNHQIDYLRQLVKQSYTTHLDALVDYNKMQLLSRLYLYSGDQDARDQLIFRFSKQYETLEAKNNVIRSALQFDLPIKNAATLRAKHLKNHPKIRQYSLCLIEGALAESIFNIDLRDSIKANIHEDELHDAYDALLKDHSAISILSTYATNFIYLYNHYYLMRQFPEETLIEHSNQLNTDNPDELLLYFYFITHCVIGATSFYSYELTQSEKELFIPYLEKINSLLDDEVVYKSIHLDCKLETIIANKLCSVESPHQLKIEQEALHSAYNTKHGVRVIDNAYVINSNKEKTSFTGSQHRNMLFIMSGDTPKLRKNKTLQ